VTTSKYVAIHFFHKEFERCKILHHHLDLIAPLHVECKFGQIDAEKCPFFIQKLQIQMLPCLVVFKDGVVVDRLVGFDAMAIDPAEPDKWHTSRLQAWIASTGAIRFTMPTEEIMKEMKKMGIVQRGTIWSENRAHDSEVSLRPRKQFNNTTPKPAAGTSTS
jgi:thioredoxin-like negative regulator of GroEL